MKHLNCKRSHCVIYTIRVLNWVLLDEWNKREMGWKREALQQKCMTRIMMFTGEQRSIKIMRSNFLFAFWLFNVLFDHRFSLRCKEFCKCKRSDKLPVWVVSLLYECIWETKRAVVYDLCLHSLFELMAIRASIENINWTCLCSICLLYFACVQCFFLCGSLSLFIHIEGMKKKYSIMFFLELCECERVNRESMHR